MNTKEANPKYDGKSTLGRLATHIEMAENMHKDHLMLIDRWIESDIEELKVSVMEHAFRALDYFGATR